MKVWFVVMDEVFFLPPYLEETLARLPDDVTAVGVTPVGEFESPRDAVATLRERAAMFGRWQALLLAVLAVFFRLGALILPDGYVAGRPLSVRAVADRHDVRVVETDDINSSSFVSTIEEANVDVVVSSNPEIFGQELLEAPRIGCINRHTSYLPQNRGLYPVYWALADRQESTGASVHWMTEGIDEGAIIQREAIPISTGDTLVSLYIEGYDRSAGLTVRSLEQIRDGSVDPIPNEGGNYNSVPDPETVRRFHAQPHGAVDLSDAVCLLRWEQRR